MPEPTESVIVQAQQNFDIDGGINPLKIELEDNKIRDILKNRKNSKYRLTSLGFLFPASVKNDM